MSHALGEITHHRVIPVWDADGAAARLKVIERTQIGVCPTLNDLRKRALYVGNNVSTITCIKYKHNRRDDDDRASSCTK